MSRARRPPKAIGKVPHPTRSDWKALIDLKPGWRDCVVWILNRVERKEPATVRGMAREQGIRLQTAGLVLRHWRPWVQHVLGPSSVPNSSDALPGNAQSGTDPRIEQARTAIRKSLGETIRKRLEAPSPATERSRLG